MNGYGFIFPFCQDAEKTCAISTGRTANSRGLISFLAAYCFDIQKNIAFALHSSEVKNTLELVSRDISMDKMIGG